SSVLTTEEMFKQLIGKVSDLEIAISFNGNMMEGIKKDLEEIKKENKNLKREHEKLKIEVQSLKNEMAILKNQAVANAVTADFQTRRNNVIMIGLSKTAEVVKVLNKLDINIKDEEIKTRQISSKGHMKPILVTFPSESVRNEVLLKRKAKGLLNSENMELDGDRRNIYINEDLPQITRDLFRKASELKNIGYMYVWVKEGKVLCRKSEFSRIIQVSHEGLIDLLKDN
ncbi:hypothetical protein WA026_012843, partial [Henosepilachna vigintioctopunctata]